MTRLILGIIILLVPITAQLTYAQRDWRDNPVVQRSERMASEAARQNYNAGRSGRSRHTLNDRADYYVPPYDPIRDARETDEFFMMQDQTRALQGIERALNDRNMMDWDF